MKLLPTILATTSALERGLGPLQAIASAHSRVRNGFTIPEMDSITEGNERILSEIFSTEFNTRLVSLADMVNRSNNLTDQFMRQGECDSSFPTLDGSCNHPEDAGRSMQSYKRLVPANYCDGKQSARCSVRNKAELPSERTISLELGKTGTATSSQVATYMFTAWGQFMTHDMIQTPDVGGGKVPCSCTPHNSCKNIKIDKSKEQVLEFPCMFVIRSSSKLGQENGRPVREQINQLSSFIDGTTVYGFTTRHKNLLLAPDKMHLRMRSNKNGDFLPNVKDINNKEVTASFQTADVFNDKGHDEFVAGDTRVLENPVLSSFHTMFARLHNVAVDEMVKLNPTWKSTRVFEEARLYVMSVMKQINYKEHLPVLLGRPAMDLFPAIRLSRAEKRPQNTRFVKLPDKEEIAQRTQRFSVAQQDDPSIRQEFMVAAYRFGHAMIPEQLMSADPGLTNLKPRNLKDNYFDPDMVFMEGPGGCLRGAMAGPTNTVSGVYAEATQHHLFKPNNFKHGVDLLSINLARGREHGVGTYNAVKQFCMTHPQYKKLYNGRQPAMKPGFANVQRVYAVPDDVDLYVGMLMEQHMNQAQVGPTAGCIILDQFIALKKGDRFWHENSGVFSDGQLQEVKSTGLSKVMCTVMEGMRRANENPFIKAGINFGGSFNGIQSCEKLGTLNFSAWKDQGDDSGTTMSPEQEVDPTKPSTETVDRSTVGCRMIGRRKDAMFECGTAQNWNDEHMIVLMDKLNKNQLPFKGKRSQMAQFPANKVKRILFHGNPAIKSIELLNAMLKKMPNVEELDISGTDLSAINADTVKGSKIGNVIMKNMIGVAPGQSCVDGKFFEELHNNLKKNNKFVIL